MTKNTRKTIVLLSYRIESNTAVLALYWQYCYLDLQDIANQYKQHKHFTMKSNVLGLENEKSRIRLGIQGTKSGETTTLEKKQLIRIKHFWL